MGDAKSLANALTYRLRIDGADRGGFRECSGLDTTQDPIDYRARSTVAQPAGHAIHIALRAGLVVDDPTLAAWQAALTQVTVPTARPAKDLSIVLLDPTGKHELRRWHVRAARPVTWAGQHLGATGAQARVDSLELVCDEVELA